MLNSALKNLAENGLHIRRLLNVSWIKTFFFSTKNTGSFLKLLLFPKTSICIRRNGKLIIDNGSRLAFNEPWFFSGPECGSLIVGKNATVTLTGGDFAFKSGSFVELKDNSKLILHGGGYASRGFQMEVCCEIEIGQGVAIGPDVIIRDNDGHPILPNTVAPSQKVLIGNKVWVGAKSIILKGVSIGEGSIIAAGSVVTRDIPPMSLAAGSPAKVVRSNVTWL